MRRTVIASLLLVLPIAALALDYTDRSKIYTDAPFSRPEAAAISLLTTIGAVEGNPDGSFAPQRTLNRAEFLKIALWSTPTGVGKFESKDCFSDVRKGDWFSGFVCSAKDANVVQGYPDGLFHPERPVNYAEALKILTKLFTYTTDRQEGDAWYAPYVRAASAHGTLLPVSISLDAQLTRGQMARLTAAFVAESVGELETYRAREAGRTLSSSSSSASSVSSAAAVSSSSVSSSSSSSSSQLSSSVSSAEPLSVRSHFLYLGERSKPIASASFRAALEPLFIRSATLTFESDSSYIDTVFLVDEAGTEIGRLLIDPNDMTKKNWEGTFSISGAYLLPKDAERVLALEARVKSRDNGGQAEKLVQVHTFNINVEGAWSGSSYNAAAPTFTFPQHQTAQARITRVKNLLPTEGFLTMGAGQLLASFSFSGSVISGLDAQIEHLEFQVTKTVGVVVNNWRLTTPEGAVSQACSFSDSILSCLNLPADLGSFGKGQERVLQVYGDVAVDQGASNPQLEVDLNQPGGIGQLGAIRWTDSVGHYTWTEFDPPIAKGPRWKS